MNHPYPIDDNPPYNEENPIKERQEMQQEEDESSNFTEDQIEIVRSYIGNLSIEKREKDSIIEQVVERIQKQTQLETKSAKHIQHLIYKLIQQPTQNKSKVQTQNEPENIHNANNQNKPQITVNSFKPSIIDTKIIDKIQQENSFPARSLFKSFNQPPINPILNLNLSNDNLPSFRKINLVTKPSIQILKSSSSNGFLAINENGRSNQNLMEIENNDTIEIPSFSKKNTNQFKQTTQTPLFKSKRKIKPTQPLLIDPLYTPQQKIQWSETNTHDCHLILQKKMGKKSGNTGKDNFYVNERLSGIYNEYFYSNYDRAYFSQQNQVSKLINMLGFDAKKLSFKQFKVIKSVLPQPKLFNLEFILSQQVKLNEFRAQLRQAPKQVNDQVISKRTKQQLELVVGRQVTALHPVCGHLHLGTILAIYKENQYMVKFTRPELGTQKVLDINISTRSVSNTNKTAVENLDYQSMVVVIKLLQYKGDLIEKFRDYNNKIQTLKTQNKEPDNHLLQQYGWVGSTINILSMGLRHIMAKFRIRGLNPTNQQLVGRNFSSLLINPLNLMSKQLQLSPQQSDIQTSNQIKKMALNRSNTRIQDSLHRLTQKHSHYLNDSQNNPQNKQNMNLLVKNFIGILLNFRYEGRNFNLQSNKFLDNIQKLIDPQYSQEFNQIHSNMHSIVKKINDNQ